MEAKKYIKIVYFLITNNCNSRCTTCSYWENKDRKVFNKRYVVKIIEYLSAHGLDTVIFSGGEPLLEKNIFSICRNIKRNFPLLKLRLLTNGLLLGKYVNEIIECFDVVVVSLDAHNKKTYKKIRGVDGFDSVVRGIKHLRKLDDKMEIRVRCVVQKENYKSIKYIVNFVEGMGADKLSFLPVDSHSSNSFGRRNNKVSTKNIILNCDEVKEFKLIVKNISSLAENNKILFHKGNDLSRIYKYYSLLSRGKEFGCVKCNVPNFSLVIDNDLNIFPCFFSKKIMNIRRMGSIYEIFENEKFIEHRKNVFKKSVTCKKCASPEFLKL